MKVPSSVSKVLTNKYVLYFVLFLAATNVLGYVVMGQLTAALFFIVVAYLISNFSQNMIVILGGALLFTNILMVGNTVKEGLTNPEKKGDSAAKMKDQKDDKKSSGVITPLSPVDEDKSADASLHSSAAATNAATTDDEKDTNVTSVTNVKPHDTKTDEAMNVMSNKRRNRIDYASTIEDAYGDLNNILGSDGIKKLTEDTQRLMSQQLQLADAMKSMTPLMENAKTMLQGFDLKNLGNLTDLAKNFNPSN
jgi:hypothetical protein